MFEDEFELCDVLDDDEVELPTVPGLLPELEIGLKILIQMKSLESGIFLVLFNEGPTEKLSGYPVLADVLGKLVANGYRSRAEFHDEVLMILDQWIHVCKQAPNTKILGCVFEEAKNFFNKKWKKETRTDTEKRLKEISKWERQFKNLLDSLTDGISGSIRYESTGEPGLFTSAIKTDPGPFTRG